MQGITKANQTEPRILQIDGHHLEKLGLKKVNGNLTIAADHVTTPDAVNANALIFLSGKVSIKPFQFPAILIVEKPLVPNLPPLPSALIFECERVKEAMAKVLPLFDLAYHKIGEVISPLAFIAPTAKIGANVHVSPGAVIEDHAQIGEGCWIGSGAVIEHGAVIGHNSKIHSTAVIGHHCVLGADCIVQSGTVIGSDGFGYIQSMKSPQIKIPQIGNVVIGDGVEFGGNCSIDRATIGSTRIGDGCKFDNLCHVAHNCKLGPHGLYAGGFFVAGSSEIGAFFSCGGNAVVADHIVICDHVALGGLSAVTKDITQPGAYTGYPLEPLKDGLKTLANLRELTSLRKDLAAVKKQLGLKDLE